ncbi:hypothetical protein CIL05_08290 [Virgibacillus profundi]|uniref:UPF0223 protein CIL05_08290 n=1 Tax=Virgibacillus profundi TaxID=2024555 RepID=A0A2A2IDR2_9BACI|nr:UPF0223 family protein [Virgibacillus profundi]PAV29869.1 hypothetical protein CIL05_08290 [Virgibacillus profundi]PXY54041.1 hypothetical protein CIT14_08375 [Virgibacillus profundi]
MSYQYPIDETWTKEEIIDVVNFFSLIEKAYEKTISRSDLIAMYRNFKEIVPSKSEEKKLFSEFEQTSGYSSYHVVKKARESNENKIKM